MEFLGFLARGLLLLIGLVFIAGGGLLALCSGGGGGHPVVLMTIVAILGLGGWLIYFACTPNSTREPDGESDNKESDISDSPK